LDDLPSIMDVWEIPHKHDLEFSFRLVWWLVISCYFFSCLWFMTKGLLGLKLHCDAWASLGSSNPHHPKIFLFRKLDNNSNKDCGSGPFYLVSLLWIWIVVTHATTLVYAKTRVETETYSEFLQVSCWKSCWNCHI